MDSATGSDHSSAQERTPHANPFKLWRLNSDMTITSTTTTETMLQASISVIVAMTIITVTTVAIAITRVITQTIAMTVALLLLLRLAFITTIKLYLKWWPFFNNSTTNSNSDNATDH